MQQADSSTHESDKQSVEESFDFKCVYMTVHDAVVHASSQMRL